MVDHGIENPSGHALLIGQAGKLAIRIIENVRNYMQSHSDEIDGERAIEIKMTGNDPKYSANDRDGSRREFQVRKKSREIKTNSSIEEKIDKTFELARFVSRLDRLGGPRGRLRDDA